MFFDYLFKEIQDSCVEAIYLYIDLHVSCLLSIC